MPTRLTHMEVREVSLVDRPANPGAFAILFKRDANHMSDAEIEAYLKRDFNAEQRRHDAGSGAAMPDGSFPIENTGDLKNAVRAIGRAKDPAAAKRHIISRARSLGATGELPDDWNVGKGLVARVLEALGVRKAAGVMDEIADASARLQKSVESILADGALDAAAKAAALQKTFAEYRDHLDGTVPEGIAKALAAAGLDAADFTVDDQADKVSKENSMTEDERKRKEADEAKDKELNKLRTENAILKLAPALQDVAKAMTEEERDAFAKMTDEQREAERKRRVEKTDKALPPEIVKALQEAEDVKKRLAVLEDERALAGFRKQAADLGLPEGEAETLQKAYAGDRAAVDKLAGALKAANAAIEKAGLFAELGTARGGAGGDAAALIMAKADEIRKGTDLTREQAIARIAKNADPEMQKLWRAYAAEQRDTAE